MYCPKCGTQNDDNALRCVKCGIAIKKTSTTLIVFLAIAAISLFFAVVSIFAFGIPAYIDYTVKAKISEVTASLEALAQAASEYHVEHGQFPGQNY
jgi:Tfp pilus assembly protein PilE